MRLWFARIAGLSRLGKLFLIAGALLVVAGAALALNPGRGARLAESLPGAATLPGAADAGYQLRPNHAADKCLAETQEWYWLFAGQKNMLWDCTTDRNRIWYFQETATGSEVYTIFARVSPTRADGGPGPLERRYLDVANHSQLSGADVITYSATGSINQQWYLVGGSAGLYYIMSANSKLCLGVRDGNAANGAAIVQLTCDASDESQRWGLYTQ